MAVKLIRFTDSSPCARCYPSSATVADLANYLNAEVCSGKPSTAVEMGTAFNNLIDSFCRARGHRPARLQGLVFQVSESGRGFS